MLTFLRKIRRSLIESGGAGKYLAYAIGEIALVVIGILIALQINNWNESRKELIRENKLAHELRIELLQNLDFIQGRIDFSEMRLEYLKQILKLTEQSSPSISLEDFNTLLNEVTGYKEYAPIINKVKKILSLDNFEFTQSDSLDEKLSEYYSSIQQSEEYYLYNVDTWKLVNQPYLIENYTLRNFNWLPAGIAPSNHELDHHALLKDRKFENVIANMASDAEGFRKRLVQNKKHILLLIEVIERDYSIQ